MLSGSCTLQSESVYKIICLFLLLDCEHPEPLTNGKETLPASLILWS